MPRLGQKLKTRKPAAIKPTMRHMVRNDPLAGHLLTRYMEQHFEWMLVTGYSADTIRARRIALKRFIVWCVERVG